MDQLSDILKHALKKRDISQSKVAELTEIERKTFNSYVTGRTEPDLITLRKIIKALGIEKEIIDFLMEHNVPIDNSNNLNMNERSSEKVESKYVALLEKTLSEKEEDLKTYRSAIDKISSVDHQVSALKTTVDAHQDKWKEYEPTILGLREFVIDSIVDLKKQSRQQVGASLDIKVEAYRKKV